ncbi:MAG: carboxylesterase family protein [Bacteroidales bacterium]|nr:carboxylesterase family protein [Bacteroidales bacterium]MBQ2105125.1 carboxylesterase family protein [Bacteroidales bacterium]MBQ2501906.1 carboxylesterase family protein [Bacteroidales bacterium]MBQ3984257.1 carboxylesterase family protein [Bacteroidales bacterium]MBQ4169966.1 carboxylesterase family protein [Bacteroidales bacterium]
MKKVILFLFSAVLLAACAKEYNPVLTIEGGQVQGVKGELKGVYVYKGIPYAAPPIGQLRWKAPQPVVPWEGVKVCDTFGHPGYQVVHYPGGYTTEWGYGDEPAYSEDCLYLNVYTKCPGQTDKKLPVAMWIHGGGLREGWGFEPEFDGEEFAAKDIVLVTINYRLGMFGFMSHPDLIAEDPHGSSGNYGIMDQVEALKWIQKNIAQFGGDPDNVMIFGQSGGGRSTRTLSESPIARGLFHKAVIMSANGFSTAPAYSASAVTLEETAQNYKEIMDWAGLDDLQKMRAASTEEIFSVVNIYNRVHGLRAAGMFAPIIDGYVCKQDFDTAAKTGNLANVPYMIGFTLNDAGDMAPGIKAFCLDREEKGGKAYAYQFARPLPDDGKHPEVTQRLRGAFHSSDLWFVFKSLKHCWRPWTQGDWDLSEKMISAWSNFAKYSDPGFDWTPCTAAKPDFMVFRLDENDAEASFVGQPLKP